VEYFSIEIGMKVSCDMCLLDNKIIRFSTFVKEVVGRSQVLLEKQTIIFSTAPMILPFPNISVGVLVVVV
jgi:hypothetical protein